MVKKMIVVLSAAAFIMGVVGPAAAFLPYWPATGDLIMVPMKVTTKFVKSTSRGGFSTFFADGCDQYTAGFRPWGTWAASTCKVVTKINPPKCIAPAGMGPVALGAPPAVAPGCKLVKNVEKYTIKSPGCNPCVVGGLYYEVVKKQVLK